MTTPKVRHLRITKNYLVNSLNNRSCRVEFTDLETGERLKANIPQYFFYDKNSLIHARACEPFEPFAVHTMDYKVYQILEPGMCDRLVLRATPMSEEDE